MTRTTQCVRPNETTAEGARRLHEVGMAALPVCDEGDDLVGTLTEEDAVAGSANLRRVVQVGEVMRPSFYCFEDQDVAEAARLMKETGARRLAVLNRRMHLVGMIWLGDVSRPDRGVAASEPAPRLKTAPLWRP
jgi:CBS domain-containing protein